MLLTSILAPIEETVEVAGDAAAQPQGGGYGNMILIIIFIVLIVWMMFIQPRKQQKKRQEQINSLEKGSKVITNSGIYGRIRDIEDKAFIIEIAEGIKIKVDKSCVYPVDDAQEATAQR